MLQIRLKRIGKAQKTVYSIVVTKKGDAINRGFLEKLGFFTLHYDRWHHKYVFIDFDRFLYWVARGASINQTLFLILRAFL